MGEAPKQAARQIKKQLKKLRDVEVRFLGARSFLIIHDQ
jgi:hypothetical protein